mmetsp:Transcript_56607/g.152276  ORF Transcript_56607/g.152276 Transcript_56607/m.152276 type:complete len:328 (+) Transcript_56607:1-984(+)
MFGRGFEQLNGERFLLKQEGRVERWPSHMQPWMAPWTRKGSRQETCHAGGCDRRLSSSDVSSTAQQLIATLAPLMQAFDAQSERHVEPIAPKLKSAQVSWPASFSPSLLASGGDEVLALDRVTGRGALLRLVGAAHAGVSEFVLKGLEGKIIGAAWDNTGLVLTLAGGAIAECAGLPADGAWSCIRSAVAPALPSGLASAVVGRDATGKFRAAVVYDGDDSVTLLDLLSEAAAWLPAGEVHVPGAKSPTHAPQLSLTGLAKELLIATADGAVHRRPLVLGGGDPKKVALAAPAGSAKKWFTACSFGADRVAHLASHHGAAPELFVSA